MSLIHFNPRQDVRAVQFYIHRPCIRKWLNRSYLFQVMAISCSSRSRIYTAIITPDLFHIDIEVLPGAEVRERTYQGQLILTWGQSGLLYLWLSVPMTCMWVSPSILRIINLKCHIGPFSAVIQSVIPSALFAVDKAKGDAGRRELSLHYH